MEMQRAVHEVNGIFASHQASLLANTSCVALAPSSGACVSAGCCESGGRSLLFGTFVNFYWAARPSFSSRQNKPPPQTLGTDPKNCCKYPFVPGRRDCSSGFQLSVGGCG